MSAPRAMHFAASSPVRRPPDAITGIDLDADLTSSIEAAVGIPQSQNAIDSLFALPLKISTALHEVPPAPPVSIAETPAFMRDFAASLEMPAPVSFAIIGSLADLHIFAKDFS